MHINADFETNLVCNALFTPGNVTETEAADALLLGGEQVVYADRAYDSAARRARYAERGIEYGILKRGNKHHPLSEAERERNAELARLRRRVECVLYKERNVVERLFNRFKRWRRITTRFDKLDALFLGFIHLALIFDNLSRA